MKSYDPKNHTCIFAGKILSGFADGTFIKVKRNVDMFSLKVGVDGSGTRSKSNDKSGQVEISLMASSASNDDLSALALLDEQNLGSTSSGVGALVIKDNQGTSKVAAATAWIKKFPDWERAKEIGVLTWVIESDEIDIFLGGN